MSNINPQEILLNGQDHDNTTCLESIGVNSFTERTDCVLLTRGQICDPKEEHKFHKFTELPSELQIMIWTFALPEPRVLSFKYREVKHNENGNDKTQQDNTDTRSFGKECFYLRPCSPRREYILNYRLTCNETERIFQMNYSKLDVDVFTPWDSAKPIIDKPYLAWSATAAGAGATYKLKQYFDKKRDTLFVLSDRSLDLHKPLEEVLLRNTFKFPRVENIAVYFSEQCYRVLRDFASLQCLKSMTIVMSPLNMREGDFSDMKFLEVHSNSSQRLGLRKRQTFRGKDICEHKFERFPVWGDMNIEKDEHSL
ncbi:hypothetical protein IFR05_014847 [Cadophora sp. M221]|nr:hypothetical protein IFR05_014847 [Cadophora sp. M221]